MLQHENALQCRLVLAVAAVISGVANEDTSHGARTELFRSYRSQDGVAQRAKDAEFFVVGGNAYEKLVRVDHACGTTGAYVDNECRGGEGLCRELQRGCTVEKKCVHAIVKGAEDSLSLAVLLGCVCARKGKGDTMSEEEGM